MQTSSPESADIPEVDRPSLFAQTLPRPTPSATLAAAVLVLAALVGRAVYCITPVNSDTAMFVYAGKLVAAGGRPGVDLIDNKLPSVGLLMSVPYRAFGADWSAYGLLGFGLSVLASLLLARAARRVLGESAALVVAVGCCVWMNFTPAVYGQLQLETITTFFAAIAGACAIQMLRRFDWRDAFTIGLCAGTGAWAKPTGLAVLGAAGLACLLATGWPLRTRIAALFWMTLGAGVPILLCVWLIVITGMADAVPATLAQLHDYAAASTFDAMDAAKPLMVVGLVLFPLLVIGFIFRRHRQASAADRAIWAFVLFWFIAELAGVIAQRRMYAYHFITLAPPAALCIGLVGRRVTARSLGMAFGPLAAASFVFACLLWRNTPAESRDDRLIAYLRAHVAPGTPVWMDDYPRLLVQSDFQPGSAVPLVFLFANSADSAQKFGRRMIADFERRRPAMIVLPSDTARVIDLYHHHMAEIAGDPRRLAALETSLHAIDRYVAAHYRPQMQLEDRTLWRLNDDPVASVNLPRD